MQATPLEHRLSAQAHDAGEDHEDQCAAQKHDLTDVKNLGDVLYDGVVGGDHRHREDHEKGCFQVVEFHSRRLAVLTLFE